MVNLEKSLCSRTSCSDGGWWTLFTLLVLASVASRFYSLHEPDHVCWDETHFGKFAGYYINRTFFFDVHPPLGKMLIGLFGHLDGYRGDFPFSAPGEKFDDYPYLGMRMGCATMGALLVPLTFLTVWEMTFSLPGSAFAASMILFDNGVLTLSRFILLDPAMLFFISLSFYCSVKFQNQRHRSFSLGWWFWLSSIGVALSAAVSVKFVGLFIVLLVGLQTITDLWIILGDLSHPVSYTLKHFMARILCLIVLPALLYIGTFYIHLSVLNRSGPGDGFYSMAFQINLDGNELQGESTPHDVEYGVGLTLKSTMISGGYLHSHEHTYPEEVGPPQQQITTYPYSKDLNNVFVMKRTSQVEAARFFDDQLVRNGDIIRLQHDITKRCLHSHNFPAPMTLNQYQVTGYGLGDDVDPNDLWELVIEDAPKGEALKAMTQRFQLVHYVHDCVLASTINKLPIWGFEQQEVICSSKKFDTSSFWRIQSNNNPRLPKVNFRNFSLNFLQSFIESHKVMLQGNSGLKAQPNEQTSKPWMWPINIQGQFFSYFDEKSVYLLGNPIIWWSNLVFMTVFILFAFINTIQEKRHMVLSPHQIALRERALNATRWLFIGWLVHYVPFWTMTRILYFHHYFPSFLFSCMLSGVILDYIVECVIAMLPEIISTRTYNVLIVSIVYTFVYSFYLFAPLTYGFTMNQSIDADEAEQYLYATNKSSMSHLRWVPSWEF